MASTRPAEMKLDEEQVAIQQAYDDYPYESYPFPLSHPEHIATLASLFGIHAANVEECRVLELGCASGGNLIPMAAQFPRSQFFGIDLSGKQVEQANETIKALKLKNIKIEQKNILDLGGKIRKFDFIICHGVYSWVPEDVQTKILQICKKYLNDNGVVYVSYNTYPGWRMRESVRDMMRFHTAGLDKSQDKVTQSRALLKFLVDSVDTENNAYGKYLESELKLLSNAGDAYLAHDHLERNNTPVYFYEFCQAADQEGLQYLAESELQSMLASNFPSRVVDTLSQAGNNIILQEQYMDFLRNRTFRSTLLCHKEIELNRNVDAGLVKNMHISALPMRILDNQEGDSSTTNTYLSQIGIRVNIPNSITSTAFNILNNHWPAAIAFDSLYEQAAHKASTEGEQQADILAADILKLYAAKAVELHILPSVFQTMVSEKPKASDLARYQAASGHALTNMRHELAKINEPTRLLVLLLDGSNTQDELLEKMLGMIEGGQLVLREGEVEITDKGKRREFARQFLDRILNELAKRALLVS